ncbi:MAG: hypothetical protein FD156_1101 [Nitrospirae bacterium]|nr:MAG: hypothetical protein FD156_1101 [Nitrospirota bacterium]
MKQVIYIIKTMSIIYLLLLIGCTTHIDYLYQFHIAGTVVGFKNETPTEKVEILFVDTGFIPVKGDKKIIHKIGLSGEDGNFDLTFDYWWGYKKTFYTTKPKETFDLIFKKEGFEEKIISYDSKALPQKDNVIQVGVGKIYLVPKK